MARLGNEKTPVSISTDEKLAEYVGRFYADPYGWVMGMFPWGELTLADGSPNPLKDKKGPEPWQKKILIKLGEHIKDNILRHSMEIDYKVWRSAVSSGHGVGKSALVAWLILFFMSTRVDTRGVVTANTQFQLDDKTWPELAKWNKLFLCKHWFTWTATSYYFSAYPEEQQKNYRIKAATVSKENSEAFQGLHNETGAVIVIFDEASGIDPKIWEVSEGALTDGEGFFFAFGNPTQPEGQFADCFDKHESLYYTESIDSRLVSHTNKSALQDIINKYGEDSDEARIRVYGKFPRQSYNGFIMLDGVQAARDRELTTDHGAALIMAVDVARFGRDNTVIGYRQGRDARSFTYRVFNGLDVVKVANLVAKEYDIMKPDALVIESVGIGAGVVDILKDRGYRVHECYPGAAAEDYEHYANKRAEMWAACRDAIYEWLCLDDDEEMAQQLTGVRYSYDRSQQKILLESKEDMKMRGLPSPDKADTLALTFAVKVARRDRNNTFSAERAKRLTAQHEYDPIDY